MRNFLLSLAFSTSCVWIKSPCYDNSKYGLDINCGTGDSTHKLKTVFPDHVIIGIDREKPKIKIAKERQLPCLFMEGDITKGIFHPNSFDVIQSRLTAVELRRQPRLAREISTILKKNGVLHLQFNLGEHPYLNKIHNTKHHPFINFNSLDQYRLFNQYLSYVCSVEKNGIIYTSFQKDWD